jgi:DNA-binding transcriptional regulator PaaX
MYLLKKKFDVFFCVWKYNNTIFCLKHISDKKKQQHKTRNNVTNKVFGDLQAGTWFVYNKILGKVEENMLNMDKMKD